MNFFTNFGLYNSLSLSAILDYHPPACFCGWVMQTRSPCEALAKQGPAKIQGGTTVSVKLSTRQVGDVTVIDVVGRITLGEGSSTFRDAIRDLVAKGDKKLLLNLSEVSYIDHSGIGELVSGFTTVTNYGGQLKLVGLTKRVKDLLQITRLYTVLDVYDYETSAVRSFR